MTTFSLVETENLSLGWAKAIAPMLAVRGVAEIAPLCVSIVGVGNMPPKEEPSLRAVLDAVLLGGGRQTCHTVANTIFPQSMWNPASARGDFFARYERSLERMRKASTKNVHGLYFQRMIQGGPTSRPNQLDFIIENYNERPGVRRSALQIAIFDASKDQTKAAQRGFPCLQHVTFAPVGGKLNVNAFYATQYAFERAYGNYLGLCRLGHFVAHELKLTLDRVTCFTGIMLRDKLSKDAKTKLRAAIKAALGGKR